MKIHMTTGISAAGVVEGSKQRPPLQVPLLHSELEMHFIPEHLLSKAAISVAQSDLALHVLPTQFYDWH